MQLDSPRSSNDVQSGAQPRGSHNSTCFKVRRAPPPRVSPTRVDTTLHQHYTGRPSAVTST
eukprot:3366244-Prymnesium_polylepis.1